jgi:hypothetical protein
MATPDHVAELYSVPPTQFTATRNRIAAELRKRGRSADARAVARLRRPSAALWAVNRLAGTDRKGVAGLVELVDHLRRAQLRDPRAAAEALRSQRAALEALLAQAKDLLVGAGLSASSSILRRVGDTLMGAAVDRAHSDALRRGQLAEELPAPGFEAFSGARVPAAPLRLVPPPAKPATAPPRDDEPASRTRPAAAERQRRIEQAERLEREAADHERSVTKLEGERAAARATLADVETRLRSAGTAARRATAAANRARGRLR